MVKEKPDEHSWMVKFAFISFAAIIIMTAMLSAMRPIMYTAITGKNIIDIPQCELNDLDKECYRYYPNFFGASGEKVSCNTQHDYFYYEQNNYNCIFDYNNQYYGKQIYEGEQ